MDDHYKKLLTQLESGPKSKTNLKLSNNYLTFGFDRVKTEERELQELKQVHRKATAPQRLREQRHI